MQRRKILYIQHSGANGGAPMSLFYLVQHVRQHHDVVVYFIQPGPAADFFREQGIRVVVVNNWSKWPHCTIQHQSLNPLKLKFYRDLKFYGRQLIGSLRTYRELRAVLENEHPDLVHLNSSVLLVEGMAVKDAGIPLVWHMRDYLERGMFGLRHILVSKVIQHCADHIVALSESEAHRVGYSEKVRVIPNFVHLDQFNVDVAHDVDLRERFSIPVDAPIFAMLGWNTPSKGAVIATEALRIVRRTYPDARLLLFGTGAPKAGATSRGHGVYQEILDLLYDDMSDAVIFAGTVFDVANHLLEVNVVLAPFTEPHFARPALEAGAMRRVVITSDLDGTREMVLNGEAGYLVEPGDAKDLADNMMLSLSNDNSDMIERMYRNVQHNYNASINAQRTMDLYAFAGEPATGS